MKNNSVAGVGDFRPPNDQVATVKPPGEASGAEQAVGESDAINPRALKTARKRRSLTQSQLAGVIGCSKDTVSRWERGKSRRVRSHLRQPLCDALQVTWKRLTERTNERQRLTSDVTINVSIRKDARASLQFVAERYSVSPREVLNLAPLLFLIFAERSLLTRQRRLEEIHKVLQEAEGKLLDNSAHLGGIVCARSISADEILEQEEKSLGMRDVFGRMIEYQYRGSNDEGPFARFVRDLAKDLPKHAVTGIESYGGDMIETYRIAEDTLRECAGLSEDEEQGKELLHYLRFGYIDFAECLRVRRDSPEKTYRQWLSDALVQAEAESQRELEALFENLGALPVAANELDAADNGSTK